MTPGHRIQPRHLPAPLLAGSPGAGEPTGPASLSGREFPSLTAAREDFEKRYIWRKYQECGGNMSRTAEALQVERSTPTGRRKASALSRLAKAEPVRPGGCRTGATASRRRRFPTTVTGPVSGPA